MALFREVVGIVSVVDSTDWILLGVLKIRGAGKGFDQFFQRLFARCIRQENVQNSVETRGSPELVVYAAWAWAGGGGDSLPSWSSNFGKCR